MFLSRSESKMDTDSGRKRPANSEIQATPKKRLKGGQAGQSKAIAEPDDDNTRAARQKQQNAERKERMQCITRVSACFWFCLHLLSLSCHMCHSLQLLALMKSERDKDPEKFDGIFRFDHPERIIHSDLFLEHAELFGMFRLLFSHVRKLNSFTHNSFTFISHDVLSHLISSQVEHYHITQQSASAAR